MVGKVPFARAALSGAACLVLPVLPALAQEDGTGGVRFTLEIENRLEAGRNLALDTPAEGTTTAALTRLGFGMVSETRNQRLSFGIGGALRLAKEPDDGTEFGIDAPYAEFNYARVGANAAFAFDARYARDRVETLDTLAGEEPGEVTEFEGEGERDSYRLAARLALGTAAPLGVEFEASTEGNTYRDTTDPDLYDTRTDSISATARLRFSAATSASLGLRHSVYEAEDDEETRQEITGAEIGLLHALSRRATIDAGIGYANVETREFGVITRNEGPEARIGLDYAMPNGAAGADFLAEQQSEGARYTVSAERALDLPRGGAVSARLGLTKGDGYDPELIGELTWRQELPAGSIDARLARDVVTTTDDTEASTTALALGLSRELDPVSGLDFGLSWVVAEETGENRVERAEITAAYRRALTEDWNMNIGVSYAVRDEETVGRAESPSVFLSLGRSFEWRR